MTDNHGNISIKGLIIIFLLFLVALLFIILGIYLSYTSDSKKIIEETINNITNTISNVRNNEDSLYLNDSFSLESNIKTTSKLDETNEDIKDYIDFINNISKIETNITVTQDKENEELFYTIESKKNNENYINYRYLIKDSTGYYYNDYVTNKYINVGNNNYFETLKKDSNTIDNIKYLKKCIIESLSNNLSTDYSYKTQEETEYNNTYVKANRLTIELDNKKLNKLYKSVIKDLKNDEKALFLLSNYFEGFEDKTFENKKFLDKKESIMINIYTTGLTNSFIKLEIIKKNNNEEKRINYEKIDDGKKLLYIISKNRVDYRFEINEVKEGQYDISVYNNKGNDIGTIKITKTGKEKIIDVLINTNNKRLDIDYKYSLDKINEKKFNETISLDIKYLVKNNNILTLSSEINNQYNKKKEIKVNYKESISEKKLTEEQIQRKNDFFENKKKEILGGLYEKKK